MDGPEIDENDELLLLDRGYAHSIKTALIFLLLGGGFLVSARLLGLAATRLPLASIAELLGWGSLASTSVVLYNRMRSRKELPPRRDMRLGPMKYPRRSFGIESHRSKPWPFRILTTSPAHSEDVRRAERIDRLYAELHPLMSRASVDPSLEKEVQTKLSLLRQLQSAEADEMEKRFEETLLLKPGEGWKALERAREILARYENPSAPDTPTERKD